MSWSPKYPYNDLPLLPPKVDLETVPIFKALVPARAELSGLNEALVSLPNPDVFVNSLALLEAQASSEVENIVTTTDDLFRADSYVLDASPATREALRYKAALFHGQNHMQNRSGLLTVGLAEEVCSEIRGTITTLRRAEGTYIGNSVTGRRIYTPPAGKQLLETKLQNWAEFVNSETELDPLVQMAVAHYQFEAIHPFDDGNGRTGRILNVLMLVARQLLQAPILYISKYIIRHKNEYYRLLNAVTEHGAWDEWVVYMLHAVESTARSTRLKIKSIQQLQAQFIEQLTVDTGTHYPANFSEVLFSQPYCRVKDVIEGCSVSRPTATKYLNALVDAGMLEIQAAGREKLYVNTPFMSILRAAESDV